MQFQIFISYAFNVTFLECFSSDALLKDSCSVTLGNNSSTLTTGFIRFVTRSIILLPSDGRTKGRPEHPVKVPAKSAFAISLWLANLLTHLYTWPVGVVSEWKFTCGVPSGTSTGNNYKAKQLRIISNWAPGACRTRLPPKCNDRIIIGLVSLPLLLRNPLMESVDRALVLCFPLSLPDNSNQFGTRVHAPINIWLQVKSGRLAYPSQWIG